LLAGLNGRLLQHRNLIEQKVSQRISSALPDGAGGCPLHSRQRQNLIIAIDQIKTLLEPLVKTVL
jgi:hypothetical protein